MRKVLLIFSIAGGFHAQAQPLSTRDSISLFYDSLLYQLKTHYLYTEETDWEDVLPIRKKALEANSFGESLTFCTELFDEIDGSHLNIFSDFGWFQWSKGRQYQQEEFHMEYLLKYETNPGFEVKLIKEKYGYILMPAMLMIDLPQDSLDLESQKMYDRILEVVNSKSIEGWIIDLRFNGGGNVFPMLVALYHFLGDNTVYTLLDKNLAVTEIVNLENGTIFDGHEKMASIRPVSKPDLNIPVALITGIISGSSGELIPVSFSGRSNVKIIGEPSAGLLTGNELTQLPFNVKLTLTAGYLADRRAQYTPYIEPEILVIKQANFKDLAKDPNVMKAVKYIESVD